MTPELELEALVVEASGGGSMGATLFAPVCAACPAVIACV